MSDKAPAPEEKKLTAHTVFERLLTYADRPWKAVVILVLVIICGIGYLVWTERARIADAVLTSANDRARLDELVFLNDGPRLLRDTRADFAMLVEVDVNDNLMTDRLGVDTDGNRWVPSTGPQQMLQPNSSMPILVKFLANEVFCVDTSGLINEDARVLAAKGFTRVCLVSVPPILGVGVGGLIVAWRQTPLPAAELRAGYAMRAAALKYATW
jgi:hypothetical protein